jgi:hypothetical protein
MRGPIKHDSASLPQETLGDPDFLAHANLPRSLCVGEALRTTIGHRCRVPDALLMYLRAGCKLKLLVLSVSKRFTIHVNTTQHLRNPTAAIYIETAQWPLIFLYSFLSRELIMFAIESPAEKSLWVRGPCRLAVFGITWPWSKWTKVITLHTRTHCMASDI